VLDDRVRTWEDQARVTIVESNKVRWCTTRVADLHDLPCPIRMPDDVPVHMQPVADYSLHPSTSSG
jgi:hypothetical protein